MRHRMAAGFAAVCIGVAGRPCIADPLVSRSPSPAPSSTRAPLAGIGRVSVASKTRHALSTLPIQADLIGAREIHNIPGRTIESALATIPGFSQAGTSSWFIGQHSNYADLRGLGPGSVLVTFDGVPLNDPLGSWVTWSKVPKLLVGSIEAAHGGASALYGSQALGGAIAIESVHPTRDAAAYDAFTGNLGTTGTAVDVDRVLSNGWGASVYAERDDAKGYIRGATPNSNSPTDPYARFTGQRYRAQLSHGDAGSGMLEFGASGETDHRSGDFTGPTWYSGRNGFARYTKSSRRSSFDSVAYISNDSYTFDRFSGYKPVGYGFMSLDTSGLILSASRVRGAVTWTIGAEGRNVAGNRNEPRLTTPSTFVTGNQQFAGVYLQADAVAGRHEVLLGTRYDTYSQRQAQETMYGTQAGFIGFPSSADHHVSPRIAYRYQLSPRWVARASFGDAFKAPDWGALYSTYPAGGSAVVVGNPLLKAMTTDQTEGGLEWDPNGFTRAYVTFYTATENDRIVQTRVSPTLYTNKNVSKAQAGGYELAIQRQIGEHVAIRGSYANSPTTIVTSTTPATAGNAIPSTPRSSAYVSARWFDARSTIEAELRSIGRAYADEQNTQPIDGAVLVNLAASRSIGLAGDVYVEAQNIFNRQWMADATTYAPPRSIVVGIRRSLR
jgi:outer membrane receptor protein involved in Fe transport